MYRILFVFLIFQAVVLAQNPAVETVRSKLRPSLVEISKRVLIYSVEGDFKRAGKAAEYLTPLSVELGKIDVLEGKYLIPLGPALKSQDPLQIRKALRRLILADIHFLLSHLQDPQTKQGLSTRTRLLMAQQDLKFLLVGIPKDKQGEKVRHALDKLFKALIQIVPNKAKYREADDSWVRPASQYSSKILTLLDSVILPILPKEVKE